MIFIYEGGETMKQVNLQLIKETTLIAITQREEFLNVIHITNDWIVAYLS